VRRFALAAIAVVVLGAAGYCFLGSRSWTVRLSETALRQELEQHVPFTRTYLLLFEVTLDNPRVTLPEGADRMAVGFDAMVRIRTRGSSAPLRGALELSGGVRYDPGPGELYLTDARVDRVTGLPVPPEYVASVNEALTRAVAEYMRRWPIYTLVAENRRQRAARLLLRDVTIEDSHLVLTFRLR
jgi:hypothetical protein